MKARRLVAAAALALSLCAVPSAFAGNMDDPWSVGLAGMTCDLISAAVVGIDAALTVL